MKRVLLKQQGVSLHSFLVFLRLQISTKGKGRYLNSRLAGVVGIFFSSGKQLNLLTF